MKDTSPSAKQSCKRKTAKNTLSLPLGPLEFFPPHQETTVVELHVPRRALTPELRRQLCDTLLQLTLSLQSAGKRTRTQLRCLERWQYHACLPQLYTSGRVVCL